MTDPTPSPQHGGQPAQKDLRKKLRKQEQRMLARLQKAQEGQTRALERFKQAETRLQKRQARVQRVEGRLQLIHQQLAELEGREAREGELSEDVRSARMAALAVEEEVRRAAETIPSTGITMPIPIQPDESQEEHVAIMEEAFEDLYEFEVGQTMQTEVASPEAAAEESLDEDIDLAGIEVEEDLVEAITAVSIAEVAAERAAKAEAVAEASSAQTREARLKAMQADQTLSETQAAIRGGNLNGEGAEYILQEAEREATRAHALLADAEAAEEQAMKAAMEAEAEAEVAEGMAYAVINRTAPQLMEEVMEEVQAEPRRSTRPLGAEEAEELDTTLKIPSIRPQEHS